MYLPPIEAATRDLREIGHKTVHIIDRGVHGSTISAAANSTAVSTPCRPMSMICGGGSS